MSNLKRPPKSGRPISGPGRLAQFLRRRPWGATLLAWFHRLSGRR